MTLYEIISIAIAIASLILAVTTLFILSTTLGLQVEINQQQNETNKQQKEVNRLSMEKHRREIMPAFKIELLPYSQARLSNSIKLYEPENPGTNFEIIINDINHLHIVEQEMMQSFYQYFDGSFSKEIELDTNFGFYYSYGDIHFGMLNSKI
ncbi:MAG TPA: hypothetical protein VGB63_10465 [Pedobacter sp.]|jgi:hypothetical protein